MINNVFTPWTYDKYPTVFTQLEQLEGTNNEEIQTTAIADWNVINAIAGTGTDHVDTNIYTAQKPDDPYWDATDDAVGAATVEAINNTPEDTNAFIYAYFVGVDENGHNYGGASPEYAAAINNVDDNLGQIVAAVAQREAEHPEEEWTIIVVTDHGHQPQQGFGHGFQSPDETATFVIAAGPDFGDGTPDFGDETIDGNGFINQQYEIVDTTPTVVTLFGGTPAGNPDGVSLTTLGPGTGPLDQAELEQALLEAIAMNQPPDIVTNIALSLRTIFATIPYYVYDFTSGGTMPIPVLGDALYVATNIPAQIVARLTGVTGARIFPLLPPGPPSWPEDEAILPDSALLVCGGPPGSAAGAWCGEGSVA